MGKSPDNAFALDLQGGRRRVRDKMKGGAAPAPNTSNHAQVIEVLNDALVTEIVSMLRYKNHAYAARDPDGQLVAAELLEHTHEEQQHGDQFARGIDPHMLREDLIAQRIAIETCAEIARRIGDSEPATRHALESILVKEEEHADDLARLLADL